jgi:restriction system protein
MSNQELAPSRSVAIKTIGKAFELLKASGGEMSRSDILEKLEALDYTDWERGPMSNGVPRWKTIFLFCTVDCTKAGYLIKNKSTWILTKEGEEAMKNGTSNLLTSANKAYRKWFAENKKSEQPEHAVEEALNDNTKYQDANLELIEEQAGDGIIAFLNKKNPYEFQKIVAALLRAMGYHTAFIAERGKDGGVDIIAYQDVLGLKTPRIKVQVKHYPSHPVTVDPIRSLKGLLNQEEVGLFVTSGTFTSDARRFAREATTHIKLIEGDELIELWRTNYDKLTDEDKNMLPLKAIFFLGSNE